MHAINTENHSSEDQTNPLVENIIGFVRFVRDNGFKVGIKEECDALIVARYCNVINQRRLKWGLRSLLCNSSHDWERFDELFEDYWLVTNFKSQIQSSSAVNADGKQEVNDESDNPNNLNEE